MGEAPKIQILFLVMGQSRKVMAKNKEILNLDGTPQLIDMNHSILYGTLKWRL
jgi:hypothetical protein